MILQSLKHAAWPALIACAALAACSKAPATQDGYVNATIDNSGPGPCNFNFEQILLLGTPGITAPTSIPTGEGSSTIDCSVTASGGKYDVALSAGLPGGEQFVVTGTVDPTTGGTVAVSFVNQSVGAFQQGDCTLTFTYAGGALPTGSTKVGPGEIFGHVSCPLAVDQGGEQLATADGGVTDETCNGQADFLFTNCSD